MPGSGSLKIGDVLDGRYRIERRIGGGGMGTVWEGVDTLLGRTVAIKVLLASLADDSGFRERFLREARAIAVLQGPGIVEVYDYGEIESDDSTIAYLVMQHVEGKPLSRLLNMWGRLNDDQALPIIAGVADALHTAHEAGIVHRDVKPGNILVRDDGSVVLVDFGIARSTDNITLTTTGVVLGTVTYMSPEQAAGENLTSHSDIYSLGVVAHQCLAGSPPFKADTPLGVLSAHLRNEPPALPTDVPSSVGSVIRRALMKEPANRWPDAASFAAACRAAVSDPAAVFGNPYIPGSADQGSPSTPRSADSIDPNISRGGGYYSQPNQPMPPEPSPAPALGRHARHSVPVDAPYGGLPAGPLADHEVGSSAAPSISAVIDPTPPPGYGPQFSPPYADADAGRDAEFAQLATGSRPLLATNAESESVNHPLAEAGPTENLATVNRRTETPPIDRLPPETGTPPPSKRRLWLIVAVIILLVGSAGTIAALAPWERPLHTEVEHSGETAENTDGDPASVDENPGAPTPSEAGDDSDDQGADSGEDSSPSDEPTSAESSPDLQPSSPTESESPSDSPSPSPTEDDEPTTTVPDVIDRSENSARHRIEEAALNPRVRYDGDGDHECSVSRQYPRAGSEVDEQSTVNLTIKRVEDEDDC